MTLFRLAVGMLTAERLACHSSAIRAIWNTATAEEIEALAEFIKSKMFSSEEWKGRTTHEQYMRGGGSGGGTYVTSTITSKSNPDDVPF